MSATFENLRVLQSAEEIADGVWEQVTKSEPFAKDVVGGQLVRAVDSIGANIAESFGRFHFGEKLQFLYYARGSLFETKYWFNRALNRNLIVKDQAETYIAQLTSLVRQLNGFTQGIKKQRNKPTSIRETAIGYTISNNQNTSPFSLADKFLEDFITSPAPLFNEDEIEWLQSFPEIEEKP